MNTGYNRAAPLAQPVNSAFMVTQERPGFIWLGNHPAPDLCNTTPVIGGVEIDLLDDAASIEAWAREAGLSSASAGRSSTQRDRATDFVRRLRTALRAALEAQQLTPALVTGINEALDGVRGSLVLAPDATDPVAMRAPADPDQLCIDLAAAVLDIFRYDRARVRRCANPRCVLLFLDVSKSGLRRWCDMATCGNRAKVSAHHARRRR